MVKINNKEFKIYDLDSNNTIYERIAADMETLPDFLIFKEGIPDIEFFSTDKNIEVINLLEIIKNIPNIKDIYTQIKKYEKDLVKHITFETYVYYYIILNTYFEEEYNRANEYEILKRSTIQKIVSDINFLIKEYNIKNYFNVEYKLEELWLRKQSNKKNLDIQIKNNIDNWTL